MLFIISTSWASTNCMLEECSQEPQHPTSQESSIVGSNLEPCSTEPLTGFYRDSFCRTGSKDKGAHVVCAEMTDSFLRYTKSQGNDLQTPALHYNFPGLKAGDRWCLCASRWYEAYKVGAAPTVIPSATNKKAESIVPLPVLLDQSLSTELAP